MFTERLVNQGITILLQAIDFLGTGLAALFAIVLICVELAVLILFILTLWRLYVALGIYIKEHKPEEDEEEEEEAPVSQEQK